MSMILTLRRADPVTLAKLCANPELGWDFMNPEEQDYEPEDMIDFDKAWNALHFILARTDWGGDSPLAMLLNDHEHLGEEHGYGPAWIVTPDRVKRFDDAFQPLSDEALAARFDPADFVGSDMYSADIFAEEDRDEILEYLLQGVPALRRLTAKCVSTDSALIGLIG